MIEGNNNLQFDEEKQSEYRQHSEGNCSIDKKRRHQNESSNPIAKNEGSRS